MFPSLMASSRIPSKSKPVGLEQLFEIFKSVRNRVEETLFGMYFGPALSVRAYSILSVGTSHETIFSPEAVFKHVYISESKTFALIHDYPSVQMGRYYFYRDFEVAQKQLTEAVFYRCPGRQQRTSRT